MTYTCRPVIDTNKDNDLVGVVGAIRDTVEALLVLHPEGHRAVVTEPQIAREALPLGFDVWELDGPPEDGGEPVRLLARLVVDDTLIWVFGFDRYDGCRSQATFNAPQNRADLIVQAVVTETDRGLAE